MTEAVKVNRKRNKIIVLRVRLPGHSGVYTCKLQPRPELLKIPDKLYNAIWIIGDETILRKKD